jgi:adenylylsulfate kinase-like enzyme
MIYWFTGQPCAGKTTLARLLVDHFNKGYDKDWVYHIDGDDLRKLTSNVDYSKQGRINNIETAQKIAHYLNNLKLYNKIVVSLVSPYREQRENFKQLMGDNIKEFYIHTSESRERESYKVNDYEPPVSNFIDIDTTNIDPEDSLIEIIKHL